MEILITITQRDADHYDITGNGHPMAVIERCYYPDSERQAWTLSAGASTLWFPSLTSAVHELDRLVDELRGNEPGLEPRVRPVG